MTPTIAFFLLLALSAAMYWLGVQRAGRLCGNNPRLLNSLPGYYGAYAMIFALLPGVVVWALWALADGAWIHQAALHPIPTLTKDLSAEAVELLLGRIRTFAENPVLQAKADALLPAVEAYTAAVRTSHWLMALAVLAVASVCGGIALRRIRPLQNARFTVERVARMMILLCSVVSVMITLAIVASILFEALRFFNLVPVTDFLFGLHWSPQTAMRSDQGGSSGQFGVVPLLAGTLLITLVAMLVAVPTGLFAAIYMSEYASRRFRSVCKPLLEILAGIPTVVYGYFAVITVGPLLRGFGESIGADIATESALAAGLVMGIMIIPFVSSLSDDVMNAVPQALRDASYAMGATQSETIRQVVVPAALPGIMAAVLLAVSRAIGETMIVVMAAGLSANLTLNPMESVTTVTAQIVALLVGDQEFNSPKTLAAFALGLTLFVITLVLNIVALRIVKAYREKYE